MTIQGLGTRSIQTASAVKASQTVKDEAVKTQGEKQSADAQKVKQDSFVKSDEAAQKALAYEAPKRLTSDQMKALDEQRMAAFSNMLGSMLGSQSESGALAGLLGQGEAGGTGQVTMFGKTFNVTAAQSADAAKAIAPGGEYSVDAVSTRIMDMAKALSGGDASKFSLLKDAVEKGFKAAGVSFGKELPGISKDTYTEVMKRFDDWEKELKNADTPEDLTEAASAGRTE